VDNLLSAIISILSTLFADEIKAWLPFLAEQVTKAAVRLLRAEQRERYDEEWRGHLEETPAGILRLWIAFGFYLAARRVSYRRWSVTSRVASRVAGLIILVLVAPLLGCLALILGLLPRGVRICKDVFKDRNGRIVPFSRFALREPYGIEFRLHCLLRSGLPQGQEEPRFLRYHYSCWRNSRSLDFFHFAFDHWLCFLPAWVDVARGDVPIMDFIRPLQVPVPKKFLK
jgi:hypothetical protein